MRDIQNEVDFCVVGGGMAGLCAAIAAARHGAKVALVQDRPVFGGNASSEIRMWICGAHGENNHETGILEEILLENIWRNTNPSYSIWDSILYEKARFQDNLTLYLNTYMDGCECVKDDAGNQRIVSVTGNQMTTESRITVKAKLFADCTGDGLLGALAGAEFRMGRESRAEFGESIAPEKADKRTMGLSCLIQARETSRPQTFIPPAWAYRYDNDGSLPNREHTVTGDQNFWWLEVGGMRDTIHDKEELRDELLKIAFGIWDHIKNRGDHGADNWMLDWVGFLPGKRESRRFVGDHILNQLDVEASGKHFADIVAFGGWTMDDHFPEGFYKKEAGTIFHPAPSPYGIPFRSLYSKNVSNLLFAGRNISASHCALSSSRVMATCATLGQAIGTAAALAVSSGPGGRALTPREVYETRMDELKQRLMDDDCYLPFNRRAIGPLTAKAALSASAGDPAQVRNGFDRQIGDERNSWDAKTGDSLVFDFGKDEKLSTLRLVFDSDLSRSTHNMLPYYTLESQDFTVPKGIVKAFRIDIADAALRGGTGSAAAGSGAASGSAARDWQPLVTVIDNHQRLVVLPLAVHASALRFTALETWGAETVRVFAIDVE